MLNWNDSMRIRNDVAKKRQRQKEKIDNDEDSRKIWNVLKQKWLFCGGWF